MEELSPRDAMMLSLLRTSTTREEAERIVDSISSGARALASKILRNKPVDDLHRLGLQLEAETLAGRDR